MHKSSSGMFPMEVKLVVVVTARTFVLPGGGATSPRRILARRDQTAGEREQRPQ